jgi:hypothetical protein
VARRGGSGARRLPEGARRSVAGAALRLGRREWRTAEGSGGGALPRHSSSGSGTPPTGSGPPAARTAAASADPTGDCRCGRRQSVPVQGQCRGAGLLSSSPLPAPLLDGHGGGDPSTGGSWVACHGKSELLAALLPC